MFLTKTYVYIPLDLLIARVGVYGLNKISVNKIFDNLNDQKQNRIGSFFNSWYDITGILTEPLEPLLFNIIINDLFLLQIKSEICDFLHVNTLYSCDKDLRFGPVKSSKQHFL